MKDFKPMLAGKVEDASALKYPVLVSPKLDGIRAIVVDGTVLSRKLEPIPNKFIQKTFGLKKFNGLDGELIIGKATADFNTGTTGIMSVDGEPDVFFWVFDDLEKNWLPYRQRFARLPSRIGSHARVRVVEHDLVLSADALLEAEARYLEQGYEGLMVRDPSGPYKTGRSTAREGWLLKLKRFMDSEAVIFDTEELEHNQNEATRSKVGNVKRSSAKSGRVAGGVLGALVVRDVKTKVEFNIGSGFTAAQRAKFWELRDRLLGKIVKYRYFPTGSKERPRFPTFIGFRDARDM